ncbi:MAG: DNA polymerase I [Armatimonadota bacterium]|nr:DNA polymerase I [Armatimonadota bacterium]
MPETLYLIDGHAQIFRAYYAIRSGLHSPVTGEPTHVTFGFATMLLKLLGQYHPDLLAVVMDAPGPTFRDQLFSEYKATRREAPDDLVVQIPRVLELVERFGIPVVQHPGLEADDVIATIVQRVLDDPAHPDLKVYIVSRDKDLEQLLGDRVSLCDVHNDTIVDVAALREQKGITPAQVVDLLALTGDTTDNIPGVPGIGPKTAAQLIQEFGSIEGIFANIDQIKGRRRESLEAARNILPLSRKLVTLRRDGTFPFDLESARVRPVIPERVLPLFEQLGFRRLSDDLRRLAEATRGGAQPSQEDAGATKEESGSPASAATVKQERGAYRAVTTPEELEELVATLRAQSIISVDTETIGLARDAELCGLSFAWKPGEGVYVPMRSPEPHAHLEPAQVLQALAPLLEDPNLGKCGHNVKYDASVLRHAGVRLRGVVFDSMLASALIDPSQPSHKLDFLAEAHLGYSMIPITALIGEGKGQLTMDQVRLAEITPYAAEDADIALRLREKLEPELEALGMLPLLRNVEAPLTVVLAEMEANGILCDPDELMRQGEVLRERVEELRTEIYRLCGVEFVIDSPRQLAEVLFDRLGLKPGKRTKTGRSTDIEVLEKLAAEEDRNDPRTSVPRLVIEYRQLTKLIGTYLNSLRAAIDPRTGRIHTTFHQMVTATGRLASQGPNLQNIPVRTDIGRQIRKAFVAPPGHVLICADYSQVELRILAHLSGDPGLVEAFVHDQDIHAAVAAQVFGVPPKAVTREQRANAKTINFGIIYGVTPYGLARRIEGLDVPGATALIQDYKRRFPGIDAFLSQCIRQAEEAGYVTTILGRRRSIPEIRSTNAAVRSLGERLAINSVVQGSAADLIKIAMVNA